MLRLLNHPKFLIWGYTVHRAWSDPCAHTSPTARSAIPSHLLTQPKAILYSIRAPQGFSSIHSSLSKVTVTKTLTSCHLKCSRLIRSSAWQPNFCLWASATHLVMPAGVQLWPSLTSLLHFSPQLDEVCCNITSSGSWSLPGDGSLPAQPSNKVHLTLFNSSHWNTHAENYVLPTTSALKLSKFEVKCLLCLHIKWEVQRMSAR